MRVLCVDETRLYILAKFEEVGINSLVLFDYKGQVWDSYLSDLYFYR